MTLVLKSLGYFARIKNKCNLIDKTIIILKNLISAQGRVEGMF